MTREEQMNTINEDGTAFNGNYVPVYIAAAFGAGVTILVGYFTIISIINYFA